MVLSGEAILTELMKDPQYSYLPAVMIQVIKPFVLAIPEALGEHLDKIVTLKALLGAKAAFLRYCLDNEYPEKIAVVMPEDISDWMATEELPKFIRVAMESCFEAFAEIAGDLQRHLKSQGITEEQAMASFGLRPDVLELYRAQTLTIGQLLIMQPAVIIKNGK